MFRNPRRATLLLAAAAAAAAAAGAGGLLYRRDPTTAVTVSASTPLRHLLSTASTGLLSSNPLFFPWQGVVLNADCHSDIAVVKIKSSTPLPAARLGSSSKILPGEWVVALGSPLCLQNTVTAGIVSCVDRKSSDLGLGGIRKEYIQTDCAINLGNSGGPLANLDGEIIGVNVLKALAANGLGFAVPLDSIVKIMEHFKKNGRVVRPWLGLKMLDLKPTIIAQLKERSSSFPDVRKGVLVSVIIDIMWDKVGRPFKVLVQRANNVSVILTVTPEEADDQQLSA
ncbi:hypothetical protein ACQ4PT_018266 [Festuca glaucescens]